MADSKISALPAAASAAAANEIPFNEAGTTKKLTAAQIKTFVNTANVFAAGSASADTWPKLTAGTVLTTAEDGAIEMDADCVYMCTDAGNRGVVPIIHFIRADGVRTLPNDSNENAIFNSPANGRLTLETGCYMFEALMQVTSMSGTSGNALLDWLGAGTATVGAWMWQFIGMDSSTPTGIGTQLGGVRVSQNSAASIVTAGAGTGLNVYARGTFEVTGAGTMIPSIDQVTGAAASVGIGSFFLCYRIGSTSVVSVGQWD